MVEHLLSVIRSYVDSLVLPPPPKKKKKKNSTRKDKEREQEELSWRPTKFPVTSEGLVAGEGRGSVDPGV